MNEILDVCYLVAIRLLLLSTLVHALEFAAIKLRFNNLIYCHLRPAVPRISLYNPRFRRGYHLFEAGLAAALMALPIQSWVFKLLFVFLAGIELGSMVKRVTGRTGADQVRIIAFLAFGLSFLTQGELAKEVPLVFLAFQLLLSYVTSGMGKWLSPYWKKAGILAEVFGTRAYGSQWLAKWLRGHPRMEVLLRYSAMCMMLAVPIAFFIPKHEILWLALACTFTFHLVTALVMGLNNFLFTFPMMFPGLIFCHCWLFGPI